MIEYQRPPPMQSLRNFMQARTRTLTEATKVKLEPVTQVRVVGKVEKDNYDQVKPHRAQKQIVQDPKFVLEVLKRIRDYRKKKQRSVKLPKDLTKSGEFPQRNESFAERVEAAEFFTKYLADANREKSRQILEPIRRHVKAKNAERRRSAAIELLARKAGAGSN
jgi:hypothetical protein